MLLNLISFVFRRHHFWRRLSFDEIAELYASRLLTVFAQSAINLFVAIYLYKNGYSLVFIAGYYSLMYLFKLPFCLVVGKVTAYFGPKHAILYGNLLRIPALISFAFVEEYGIYAVIGFGLFQAMSVCFYNIGYTVVFSKVKSPIHVGKEIGTMSIIEKTARIVSPLVGGVVAATISPEAAIIMAGALYILAVLPLFRSVEPTVLKTRIAYRGFPWRLARRNLIAHAGYGVDFVTTGVIWTLFVATTIFAAAGNTVYAVIGALASMGVFWSLIASWGYGKLIDKNRSDSLIIMGAILSAGIHLFRPFVSTPAGVVGANIASETTISAYAMPLLRMTFDQADTSGGRIVYMTFVEIFENLGMFLISSIWLGLLLVCGPAFGMQATFVVAAIGVLLLTYGRR